MLFLVSVWWVLGLAAFATVLSAIPMLLLLVQLRKVELPSAFWLWIGFVVWACSAALELDTASRLIGFGVRAGNYIGSGIVFLYMYNARERLTNHRAMYALDLFLASSSRPVTSACSSHGAACRLPRNTSCRQAFGTNEYVQTLVHPTFAEVQQPYGSPQTFYRPSAPFAYTNGWGCNIALLDPVDGVGLHRRHTRRSRVVLSVLLVAAFVPAFATLNRGLFLRRRPGDVWPTARCGWRCAVASLALTVVVGGGVLGVVIARSAGVADGWRRAFTTAKTNRAADHLPGSLRGGCGFPDLRPRCPPPVTDPEHLVGTQGQVWNVMFSYGFIALGFFLGWFALAALQSAGARAGAGTAVGARDPVHRLRCTFVYYGYDGPQLALAMMAAALALRPSSPGEDVSTGADLPGRAFPRFTSV